jgi:hypothetical protein
MTQRSTQAADTRAAQAALTRLQNETFDRYLVIDDSDDDITQIISIMRERSCRGLEVLS